MAAIKVSSFVKMVPEQARGYLPRSLQKFKVFLMPWLSQVYYDNKLLHYELVKLPSRYSDNRLELGLHFESRDKALNEALLTGFDHYLYEIREALGDSWCAEPWDRGWSKVYTTFDYEIMDEAFADEMAQQLARTIQVMQPIYEVVARHI